LFAANDNQIGQTDIVMLLTPRIVRSHELSQQDVSPIYIGTQQNLGLGGPPPLIAGPPPPDDLVAPPAQPAPGAPPGAPGQAVLPPGTAGVPIVPPGSGQIPGTTTVPAVPTPVPAQPAVPPAQPPPGAPPGTTPAPPAPVQPAPPVQPPAPPPAGAAQILVTPPGTEFRVGGGPYTVPVSITGASRVSSVTLTITFNPAVLRVRSVQEGSFMRQGGTATFTQQVDTTAGRVDIAITRTADATGVSGAGLLAAILFDAIAPGAGNISGAGMATAPGGAPVPLQFAPVGVTVR
jgi:hypothetical protein